ncbi:MAG: hypothetical protein JNG84_00810 [Archangium sp.]|nr:hypothetical protein [Archangium sp.]
MERLLPPRLGAILALESDVAFSNRLRRVHEAAARAIGKLGEIDLIKYEDSSIDGSADLSMWEQVAPVVGSTIADVNALAAEITEQFPIGDILVDARQLQVDAELQRAVGELREAVSALGARIRDPAVVGDRWNLMAELQQFRFRFRDRIGAMVFETASALGECRRREVDPGYDDLLASTLVVRSTSADLRRLMKSRMQKVSEAQPEDVEWNAQQLEKELNAFGRTAAWRALQAHDKRIILEFRQKLREGMSPDMSKLDLLLVVEPFVEFIVSLNEGTQRELLQQHDQEIQASVGVILERAMSSTLYADALAAFNEAVGQGQSLYGRDSEFDSFLRKLRKAPPSAESLPGEIEQFLVLLMKVAQG